MLVCIELLCVVLYGRLEAANEPDDNDELE